jgi:hypothetical protein
MPPTVATLAAVPPPVAPPVFAPIVPASARLLLDASDAATVLFGGLPAAQGTAVDTWGVTTQASPEAQPFVDYEGYGAGPCIVFGGAGIPLFSVTTWLNITGLTFRVPFIAVLLVRADSDQQGISAAIAMAFLEVSTNVAASPGFLVTSSNGWAARVRNGGGTQNVDVAQGQFWTGENALQYITIENDGTHTKISINGVLQSVVETGVAPGVGAITTDGTIGTAHASGLPLCGAVAFVGIWDSLTPTERGQLDAYLRSKWILSVPNEPQKHFGIQVGDSIAGGANLQGSGVAFHLNTPWSFSGRLNFGLSHRFGQMANFAVSGARLVGGANLPDIATQASTLAVAAQKSGVRNFIVLEGGINSLGTDTAANIFAQFQTIATGIVANWNALPTGGGGPHVLLCCTISFAHGLSGAEETDRQTINADIRAAFAGWATANVHVRVADFGADTVLGTPAGNLPNPNFFEVDGLHFAKTAHEHGFWLVAQQLLAEGM